MLSRADVFALPLSHPAQQSQGGAFGPTRISDPRTTYHTIQMNPRLHAAPSGLQRMKNCITHCICNTNHKKQWAKLMADNWSADRRKRDRNSIWNHQKAYLKARKKAKLNGVDGKDMTQSVSGDDHAADVPRSDEPIQPPLTESMVGTEVPSPPPILAQPSVVPPTTHIESPAAAIRPPIAHIRPPIAHNEPPAPTQILSETSS